MKLEPGAPAFAEISTLGEYFLSLYRDPTWVLRRVETVRLIDLDHSERRVTLDLDVHSLRRRAADVGVKDVKRVYFPLTLLDKNLAFDLDVVGPSQSPLSLVTSDRDSRAVTALLSALLTVADESLDPADSVFIDKLYDISKAMPDGRVRAQMRGDVPGPVGLWALDPKDASPAQIERWDRAFTHDDFRAAVATFTSSYLPITSIEAAHDVAVVKFRYVESGAVPNHTLGSRLGLTPSSFVLEAPSVGRAQREHLRILAPDGTVLTSIGLWKETPTSAGALTPTRGSGTYDTRTGPGRAIAYTGSAKAGTYSVAVTMKPRLNNFVRPAFITVLAAGLLAAVGALSQTLDRFLSVSEGIAEPAIAVFGLLFSLYALYLSRRDEHEIRSVLLRVPRNSVLVTVPFAAVAACSLMFPQRFEPWFLEAMWWAAALICGVVAIYLAVLALVHGLAVRAVRRDIDQTSTRSMFTVFTPNWDWVGTGSGSLSTDRATPNPDS